MDNSTRSPVYRVCTRMPPHWLVQIVGTHEFTERTWRFTIQGYAMHGRSIAETPPELLASIRYANEHPDEVFRTLLEDGYIEVHS